jgi:hypothetical protein
MVNSYRTQERLSFQIDETARMPQPIPWFGRRPTAQLRYKISAWDEVDSNAFEASGLLQTLESKAAQITLEKNGSETFQLKAISVDDVAKAFGYPPNH